MNRFTSFLDYIFGRTFVNIASLASIISLAIIAFSSQKQAIIALIAIVIFLSAILIKTFQSFNKYLSQQTKKGYKNLSTSSKYITHDGKTITYETHKYIVCKQLLFAQHEHNYSWTGSKAPVISSETMIVEEAVKTNDGDWDKVVLKFKQPLMFNDFAIIHLRMQIDDSDKMSSTHIEMVVTEKMQLLEFSAELRHKTKGIIKPARLLKKKLNTQTDVDFQLVKEIPFDKATCTYETSVYDPEPNYSYRMQWDR